MKSTVLRRIEAYILDFLLVMLMVTLLSYVPFLNPHRQEYSEKYNELVNVYDRYLGEEISEAEYNEAYVPIAYELYRLNTNYVIIDIVIVFLYFVLLPYFFDGQTIGKKLFQLRIVGKDGKELTMTNYALRAIVLNNVIISIALQCIVHMMDVDSYAFFYRNVNIAGYIIQYVTLFLVFVRKDGRGLHDMVAGTKVVFTEEQTKKRLEQIAAEEKVLESELESTSKKEKDKKVIKAKVTEKKSPTQKTTKKEPKTNKKDQVTPKK